MAEIGPGEIGRGEIRCCQIGARKVGALRMRARQRGSGRPKKSTSGCEKVARSPLTILGPLHGCQVLRNRS